MNKVTLLLTAAILSPWSAGAAQNALFVRTPTGTAAHPARVVRRNSAKPVAARPQGELLRPGDYFVLRRGSLTVKRDTSAGGAVTYQVPLHFDGVDSAGARLDVRPKVDIEAGGLHYRTGQGDFAGSVLIGLEAAKESAAHSLGRKVQLQITSSAATVEPSHVTLDHTSVPYQEVQLVTPSPAPDAIMLHVRTDLDPQSDDLPVAVLRPRLHLVATPKRIFAYGLEVATLAVQADPPRPASAATVILTADRGKVEPVRTTLDASGTGTSSIRSIGRGRATVTAESQPLVPASETVEFTFPWAFLIASLFGGLVGGFIREGWAEWQEKQRVGLWGFVGGVLLAALVGVVVVVAWAFGINLLGLKTTSGAVGEALIAVIAALGAIGGLSVIAKRMGAAPRAP